MRVLHVAKKFPPLLGGDAQFVDGLARSTRLAGHEAFVAAPNCPELPAEARVRKVGSPLPSAALDRFGLHRLRLMREFRRAWPDLAAWSSPQIVHAHSVDLGYAIARAVDPRVHVILTCHSLTFPTRPWSVRGILEKWCLRHGRFRAVTVVFPDGVRLLAGLGIRATHTPPGIDADAFPTSTLRPGGGLRLLFVGRFEPEKGLDVLLDALTGVREPVTASLIGDGTERDRLARRVRALGLESRVRLEPPIASRDRMRERYGDADAFVLPSRMEGLPLSLLEAWASGLPAIASAVGGVADFPDAALLVPREDPQALAEAITSLAGDNDLRRRLGARGRQIVREQFSASASADRFLRLYRDVLSGSVT